MANKPKWVGGGSGSEMSLLGWKVLSFLQKKMNERTKRKQESSTNWKTEKLSKAHQSQPASEH